jgi:hypothetical protein
MKNKVGFLFIALSCLIGTTLSCSKKKDELKYTPEEFSHIMGTTSASDDKNTANALNFSDYSAGVNRVNSKALIYERLSFAVLEFENSDQAKAEAMRLNQYYSRNWLFDKVEGEPLLEDLVIVKFHAINPKKYTQRKPVNIPHEGHGEAAGGGEHH